MSYVEATGSRTEAEAQDDLSKASAADRTKKLLTLALTRFKAAAEHEGPGRKEALDDFLFSIGEQWPKDILADRQADGRPCLTMDHLDQSLKLVTNDLRENRPSVQIDPAGSGATRKVADIFQGMTRHIEVVSDADVHYDIVGDHMVRGGIGFIRVYSDFIEDTFDQEIYLESIRNPFMVYSDPFGVAPDHSDHRFKFVVIDMPRAEYEKQYPDTAAGSLYNYTSIGDAPSPWISKESVRVADYYYIEETEEKIYKLPDGRIVTELDEYQKQFVGKDIQERTQVTKKVKLAKITALDILEESDLPGSIIPIIPCVGTDVDVNGKSFRAGLIRNSKEPQRMYNYQCSAATEQVALAPRAPFIGYKGQFKSSENNWKQLNRRNFPYLEVDPISIGGQPAPIPQRNVAEPPIQATVLLIKQAADDLKASMGIYDASLGEPGPEQSGKAILARQKQGDKATLNFSDNLRRCVRCVGKVLMEWIPVVYSAPRIQRIINPDKEVAQVGIYNSSTSEYSPEEALTELQEQDQSIKEVFDIGVGRYSVVVTTGPGYQTKRMEAAASIMALVQAYPNLMEICGDLLISNMDWPFADLIAKRLKKQMATAHPGLLESGDSPEAQVVQLQGQLNQMSQQHQLLVKALNDATELIKTKMLELNSRERIALINAQAGLVEAAMKGNADAALAQMDAAINMIQERMNLVGEHTTIAHEAEQERQTMQLESQLAPPEESTGQAG